MGWALYVQPQSIAIPTIAHNTIQRIINHRHLGRFQLTTTGVYGFLWVNPAVWNSTVLQEAQSIWQISLLTDGVQSIQQSICCILILSHVYSRIWTQNASVLRLQWLLYSISVLQLSSYTSSSPSSSIFSLLLGMTPLLRKCNWIFSHLLM